MNVWSFVLLTVASIFGMTALAFSIFIEKEGAIWIALCAIWVLGLAIYIKEDH
jgi:hypothetical protein